MEKYPFFMSNFLPIYEHHAYMRMECTTLFWYSCKYRNKDEEEFCIVLWQLKKFVRTCHKSIIPNAISISNGYYFKYDCVNNKREEEEGKQEFAFYFNWQLAPRDVYVGVNDFSASISSPHHIHLTSIHHVFLSGVLFAIAHSGL